jgi:hypothetical protein
MTRNGWHRMGLALSMLWLLFLAGVGWASYTRQGGGYFVETFPGQDVSAAPTTLDRCTQVDPEPPAKSDGEGHHDAQGHFCTNAHFIPAEYHIARTPDQHRIRWQRWLFCAFVPLALAWALACLLIFCFRRVAAGSRKEP